MVGENSALLNLQWPQEDTIPGPESDHSTIYRFDRTPNDEFIVFSIVDLVDLTLKQVSNTNEPLNLLQPLQAASVIDNTNSRSGLSAPHCST